MAKRLPSAVRKYMAELGRKGGKKSGETLTPEERVKRARSAAAARWKKPA
jgi:general stress protein YciG